MNMKKAVIFGVCGMDGSHMADLLLSKGYKVYGCGLSQTGRVSNTKTFIDNPNFRYEQVDITLAYMVEKVICNVLPDEIYNLAAQSSVGQSWNYPSITFSVNTTGFLTILNAVKEYSPNSKVFQPGSSEMYTLDFEGFPYRTVKYVDLPSPVNPYAISKAASFHLAKTYREAHNLFIVNGIMFSHESYRRSKKFLTQTLISQIVDVHLGLKEKVHIGSLDVVRDWGYAKEYVEGMYLSLQNDFAGDYVFASGKEKSIRDFVDIAFSHIGIDNPENYIYQSGIERPIETHLVTGETTHTKINLHWESKTSFDVIVREMVDKEIEKRNENEN